MMLRYRDILEDFKLRTFFEDPKKKKDEDEEDYEEIEERVKKEQEKRILLYAFKKKKGSGHGIVNQCVGLLHWWLAFVDPL